jgi:Holliday junction DNA helicase RuvA
MIAQIRGTLVTKSPLEVVIDCGGVGYVLNISTTTSEKLPNAGEQATLLTILVVREDAMQLFGFFTEAERTMFRLLTSISGIGPKTATGILSAIGLVELREALARNDLLRLQKLPGVGKKTAERILVELRDKTSTLEGFETPEEETIATATKRDVRDETLAAMLTLGYPRVLADKAIKLALAAEPDVVFTSEKLLRKALKNVAR